jgi:hypothetical protein
MHLGPSLRAHLSFVSCLALGACIRTSEPPQHQAGALEPREACACGLDAYTFVDDGSAQRYELGADQSLCLRSGTYTGQLTARSGSTVCVATGARLEIPLLELAGTLDVRGSAGTREAPLGVVFSEGARLDNHGLTILGLANFNGPTAITNALGATLEFRSSFALRAPGSSLDNRGLLRTKSNFDSMMGTTVTNDGVAFVLGELALDGMTRNRGLIEITTRVNLNGNADLANTCTLVSHGPYNVSGRLDNAGLAYLIADRTSLELNITSPGRIEQHADALLLIVSDDGLGGEHRADLRLDGGLRGSGVVLVEDQSICQGDGFAEGTGDAPLVFFDLTPTAGSGHLFDLQTGRVDGVVAGSAETLPRIPSLDEARAARIGSDCQTPTACLDDQPAGEVDSGCARPLPACIAVDTVNLCVECTVDSECPETWSCRTDTYRCAPPPPPPTDPVADPDPSDASDAEVDTVNSDAASPGDASDDASAEDSADGDIPVGDGDVPVGDSGVPVGDGDSGVDDATPEDTASADLVDPSDLDDAGPSDDATSDDGTPQRRTLVVEGGGCAGGRLTPDAGLGILGVLAALAVRALRARRRSDVRA